MIKRGELNGKPIIEGITDNRVTKDMYKYVETADGVSLAERKYDGTVTPVTPVPTPPARDRVREIIENAVAFYKNVHFIKDEYDDLTAYVDENKLYGSINGSVVAIDNTGALSFVKDINDSTSSSISGLVTLSLSTTAYTASTYNLTYKNDDMEEDDDLPSNATKEEVLAAYDALED